MMEYSWKSKKLIFISTIALLVLWSILSKIINNNIYLPSILEVSNSLLEILKNEETYRNILSTIIRTFESFFVAFSIGVILSLFASINRYVYNFLIPVVSILRSIPTMALIVLILVWLNKGLAPIIIGIIIAFPIIYECGVNSILNINQNTKMLLKTYNIRITDKLWNIYFPVIMKNIMKIFPSTLSLTLKVVIAGEIYGQPRYGIGGAIQMEKIYLNTPGIVAYIIIVASVTLLFDFLSKNINKRVNRRREY